jgi:seryl-tRNA synthetase
MIDLAQLEKDPDRVRKSLERRHATASLADVDRLVDLSVRRRALVTERDTLNAERNTLSAKIGGLMKQAGQDPAKADEATALKARVAGGQRAHRRCSRPSSSRHRRRSAISASR